MTYTDSFPLGFNTRAIAERAPAAYKEKWKCLASGQVPEDSFLQTKLQRPGRGTVPSLSPPETEPQSSNSVCLHPGDYLRL